MPQVAPVREHGVRGTRALIVEDDAELREALADTLELAGCRVLAAAGAPEALALLAQNAVDVVVSDVNMSDMDGHELLRRIRTLHPQVPVVLITAFATLEDAMEAPSDAAT